MFKKLLLRLDDLGCADGEGDLNSAASRQRAKVNGGKVRSEVQVDEIFEIENDLGEISRQRLTKDGDIQQTSFRLQLNIVLISSQVDGKAIGKILNRVHRHTRPLG